MCELFDSNILHRQQQLHRSKDCYKITKAQTKHFTIMRQKMLAVGASKIFFCRLEIQAVPKISFLGFAEYRILLDFPKASFELQV